MSRVLASDSVLILLPDYLRSRILQPAGGVCHLPGSLSGCVSEDALPSLVPVQIMEPSFVVAKPSISGFRKVCLKT